MGTPPQEGGTLDGGPAADDLHHGAGLSADGVPAEADAPDVRDVVQEELLQGTPAQSAPEADSVERVAPSPEMPPVLAVHDLDWAAIRAVVEPAPVRARIRSIVEALEHLLDRASGPGLLFDAHRDNAQDRVIRVPTPSADDEEAPAGPLWIIGDLHGDLLALEAALAHIRNASQEEAGGTPRIVFLGDFFDDEGLGLELLLRVFELIVEAPGQVCLIAGNHDEALSFDGSRFASSVSPSDFADFLNEHRAHEWIERAGKLAVRLTAQAPRALILPGGLLVAHGGFPLCDLHPRLAESGNWNDPACLSDFVWARAHPKARRKMPNRFSRGSQFGHADFADFCALSARLGWPVTHMVRGHDHVEDRYAIYPAFREHPVVTTVALSRRLPREQFGPHERAPTLVRVLPGRLPQVHQLHIPADLVREVFPPPAALQEEAR